MLQTLGQRKVLPIILIITLVFACAAVLTGPLVDPDLWWHITVGRWILSHREIPHVDYWNQYGQGQPWRAYSWSCEILFALVEKYWGLHGLLLLKFLLASALCVSLMYAYRRLSGNSILGTLLGAFCCFATFEHFTLRPQAFVWILFALLLAILVHTKERALNRIDHVCIFLLMLAWANIHLSTVLGIFAIAVWVISARHSLRESITAGFYGFLGTLCTPNFGGEWITFLSKVDHPFAYRSVVEFQSASLFDLPTLFLLLAVLLLALMLREKPKALEFGFIFLGVAFVAGGLAVIKFLPFALIVVLAMVCLVIKKTAAEDTSKNNILEGLKQLSTLCTNFSRRPISLLICAALLCSAYSNLRLSWKLRIVDDFVAERAMNFILEHKLPFPLLNAFGDGGYVMYRLSTMEGDISHPVIVDGRTNVTPAEILAKHHEAFTGSKLWKQYFDYSNPVTVLWRKASPLASVLTATGDWCLLWKTENTAHGHVVLVQKHYWELHKTELPSENCGSDSSK